MTGTIRYYRTPPVEAELEKVGPDAANILAGLGDKIAVGKGAPITGPFDFSRWKDPPHVALANMLVDPASALRFTRAYGVLSPQYTGKPMSVSLRDIFKCRDTLRLAWVDDVAFLEMLNDLNNLKAHLWVRPTGMEIIPDDLWMLARLLFSRDRWDGRARRCASPDCRTPYFRAVRKSQKYCSDLCAVRENVRRFREREAQALKKNQKRKRGKHAKAKKA